VEISALNSIDAMHHAIARANGKDSCLERRARAKYQTICASRIVTGVHKLLDRRIRDSAEAIF
jgi:hypothetical protein